MSRSDAIKPERPFAAPWQATAFALTVHLHQRGAFEWTEWVDTFARRRGRTEAADDGSDYYEDWVATLEEFIVDGRIADAELIDRLAAAWSDAAHQTPHGQAIELPDDRPRADDLS